MMNKTLISPSTYLAYHELCEIPTERHGKANKFFFIGYVQNKLRRPVRNTLRHANALSRIPAECESSLRVFNG